MINSKKIAKSEVAVGANVKTMDRIYRRPEIHDLGKLEQVQGGNGPFFDWSIKYHFLRRPELEVAGVGNLSNEIGACGLAPAASSEG